VKSISSFIILLAIAGTLNAKNMHKVFGSSDQIIKGASKVIIYKIEQFPIMSVEQQQGKNYIYDYPVTQTITLKRKAAKGIIEATLDTNQYLFGIAKKCAFLGKYALEFRKGTKSLTIILSSNPCDKAIIFCPGSVIDKTHIDLVDLGKIIAGIEFALNPQVIITK
jgi:hypothetical protein